MGINNLTGFGYGQNVVLTNTENQQATNYYNTTDKPIFVILRFVGNAVADQIASMSVGIDGITVINETMVSRGAQMTKNIGFVVKPGGCYSFVLVNCAFGTSWQLR